MQQQRRDVATVLGYSDDFSSPGTGAQNSPFCSPKLSSF